ncbi:dATP/dGTP diphosphohydrolase domain-containing protein [Escherichia coli]|uniref:dATP/dGTP diphosphohydrolase domain-containing protein n=1 Tax=Escherichia coli TaxID=562 RepID=UPI00307A8259
MSTSWASAEELAIRYGQDEADHEHGWAWFCSDPVKTVFLSEEHYKLVKATYDKPPGLVVSHNVPENLILDDLKSNQPPALDPAGRGGLKFDGDKARFDLLFDGMPHALEGVAKVLTFGALKYAAHSWQKVPDNIPRYRAALLRHLNAIARGEITDAESGLPHIDHATCNALFLAELQRIGGTPATTP